MRLHIPLLAVVLQGGSWAFSIGPKIGPWAGPAPPCEGTEPQLLRFGCYSSLRPFWLGPPEALEAFRPLGFACRPANDSCLACAVRFIGIERGFRLAFSVDYIIV